MLLNTKHIESRLNLSSSGWVSRKSFNAETQKGTTIRCCVEKFRNNSKGDSRAVTGWSKSIHLSSLSTFISEFVRSFHSECKVTLPRANLFPWWSPSKWAKWMEGKVNEDYIMTTHSSMRIKSTSWNDCSETFAKWKVERIFIRIHSVRTTHKIQCERHSGALCRVRVGEKWRRQVSSDKMGKLNWIMSVKFRHVDIIL